MAKITSATETILRLNEYEIRAVKLALGNMTGQLYMTNEEDEGRVKDAGGKLFESLGVYIDLEGIR